MEFALVGSGEEPLGTREALIRWIRASRLWGE